MPEPCLGGPYAHSSFMAGWTDSLPSSDLTTEYLTQMQHHHAALTCAPKALRARAPPCHHEQESLPPATINVGVLGLSVWGMQPPGLQGARCTWRLAAASASSSASGSWMAGHALGCVSAQALRGDWMGQLSAGELTNAPPYLG